MTASMPPPSLLGATAEELRTFLVHAGEPAFRARQIINWLYVQRVANPEEMANLPLVLRRKMTEYFHLPATRLAESVTAPDGTRKLLLELQDKECIEMVLIPSPERMTFCLSTQVGCPVGCRFCASGAHGLTRNLTTSEILEELYIGAREHGGLPDNIVFMGIGEGLLNFDHLMRAIRLMTDAQAIGLSPRRLTISTSGYVPGILRLAEEGKPLTLAISLHAPDEATRACLIPEQLRYPIPEILRAADVYAEKSGRMVTLEYTLLAGINDSPGHAAELARLAIRHHAKVNLIACNPVGSEFKRPAPEVIRKFVECLEKHGAAHVTLRVEKGSPEAAACGQLRARRLG